MRADSPIDGEDSFCSACFSGRNETPMIDDGDVSVLVYRYFATRRKSSSTKVSRTTAQRKGSRLQLAGRQVRGIRGLYALEARVKRTWDKQRKIAGDIRCSLQRLARRQGGSREGQGQSVVIINVFIIHCPTSPRQLLINAATPREAKPHYAVPCQTGLDIDPLPAL